MSKFDELLEKLDNLRGERQKETEQISEILLKQLEELRGVNIPDKKKLVSIGRNQCTNSYCCYQSHAIMVAIEEDKELEGKNKLKLSTHCVKCKKWVDTNIIEIQDHGYRIVTCIYCNDEIIKMGENKSEGGA